MYIFIAKKLYCQKRGRGGLNRPHGVAENVKRTGGENLAGVQCPNSPTTRTPVECSMKELTITITTVCLR